MKFMTREYIQEQAAISDYAAVKVSYEHHLENSKCSRGDVIKGKISVWADHCGCCIRFSQDEHFGCPECPLAHGFRPCCVDLWWAVHLAYKCIKRNDGSFLTKLHAFRSFHKAERKLAAYIKKVLDGMEEG